MNNAATTKTVQCSKCHGAKKFYRFGHVENGVCFACSGAGVVEVDVVAPVKRAPRKLDRAWFIVQLHRTIRAAASQGSDWLWMSDESDVEFIGQIRWTLANAPADVADRARKALAAVVVDRQVREAILAA